jgi:hypothetical protein
MNAHNDAKRYFDHRPDVRRVLAAARLRFAALVDALVADWLARCAANAETAQRLFTTDRKPTRAFGMRMSLVGPSANWDESP